MLNVSDHLLADILPNAILVFDASGKFLWCNQKTKVLFTLKNNPTAFENLFSPEVITFEGLQQADQPIELFHPKHKNIRLALSLCQEGKDYVLIAHDITHVYHLEKMRQDFIANVSHELRTPLTVLHGFIETLSDTTPESQTQLQGVYKQMFQQTLRMEGLVNDLLLLSHLETDEPMLEERHSIHLASMLEAIAEDAKALSQASEHEFVLHLDTSIRFTGIESELHSAFSNLIFNAVKYTPEKGKINITLAKENHKIVLRVRDTGIGIESIHIPRLTERFYRVDKARSRSRGGTGLGLAIVKHVLLRHQGELFIESELGQGSEFMCQFDLQTIL